MSNPSRGENVQCIHCGRLIRRNLQQCPHCREAQAEQRLPSATTQKHQTQGHFRSGLLLMLMAVTIHYFVGYDPMQLPSDISIPVLRYLVPVLFVSGLATSLWNFFLRVRA